MSDTAVSRDELVMRVAEALDRAMPHDDEAAAIHAFNFGAQAEAVVSALVPLKPLHPDTDYIRIPLEAMGEFCRLVRRDRDAAASGHLLATIMEAPGEWDRLETWRQEHGDLA